MWVLGLLPHSLRTPDTAAVGGLITCTSTNPHWCHPRTTYQSSLSYPFLSCQVYRFVENSDSGRGGCLYCLKFRKKTMTTKILLTLIEFCSSTFSSSSHLQKLLTDLLTNLQQSVRLLKDLRGLFISKAQFYHCKYLSKVF